MDHPFVTHALAFSAALVILLPALFKLVPLIRDVREAITGTASEQAKRALDQRDAMVEGAAYVLTEADALEARAETLHPEAAIVIRGFSARIRAHLRNVQIRAGVQSDLAPIVAQAKATVRGETPETGVKVPKEEEA